MGRFVVETEGETPQGQLPYPDELSIIDSISGRDLFDRHVNEAHFSPDNGLIVYQPWFDNHGTLSTLTLFRLIDPDTSVAPLTRADVPIYPTETDNFGEGDLDKWAEKWMYKPQPASDFFWQTPSQFTFLLVADRLDANGSASGAPEVYYTASVTLDVQQGKPPVSHLTSRRGVPCAHLELNGPVNNAYEDAVRACLTHQTGH